MVAVRVSLFQVVKEDALGVPRQYSIVPSVVKYSVLDNYNWRMQGYNKLRSYKDALKSFMDTLNDE